MSKHVTKIQEMLATTGSSDTVVAQPITAAWVKVGSLNNPVSTGNFDTLLTRPIVVSTGDAANIRFRIIERPDGLTGAVDCVPSIEDVSASVVGIQDEVKELSVDGSQNPVIKFNVSGLINAELQTQAGTAGTTGATISSCKFNLVEDY